ncbi:hypothetical protein ACFOEQ_00100 [Chryseobacterium arachidis]|uniref:hypothetical protein n=1 Tax=Chryseobacterium arachidis TaxID=1416778 RepID=UPI0036205A8A
MVVFIDQVGRIKWNHQEGRYLFTKYKHLPKDTDRLKLYIELRDCYNALYSFEAAHQREDPENRNLLNSLYDNFQKKDLVILILLKILN